MSKAQFKKEIVYVEKFVNKDGEEKKKYTKVGALFEYPDGGQFIKIFDTFFQLYEPRVNEEGYSKAKQAVQETRGGFQSDDIPF